MTRPPFHPNESVFSRGVGTQIIWIGLLLGFISLAVGYLYWIVDPNGPWQTMIFTTLVLTQMGNAIATRSFHESIFTIGFFTNKLMLLAVSITVALQLLLLYVPFFQSIFNTDPLSPRDLFICVILGFIVFFVIEIYKLIARLMKRN